VGLNLECFVGVFKTSLEEQISKVVFRGSGSNQPTKWISMAGVRSCKHSVKLILVHHVSDFSTKST
jgi:hypothetical protein